MIITKTPFRITLGGGGTDLPSFYREHEGFILAVAIDKYMYLNVNTPILEDTIRVQYNRTELVRHVDDVQHTLAREALRFFHIDNGIEIVSMADVPAGTGLGSSSCYLIGLLNAMHTLTQAPTSSERLAEEACCIELDLLKKPIGKQDQYMAALGGLTTLEIAKDGRVTATRLCLPTELLETLENNMLLFYTGAARDAINILEKQDSATKNKTGSVVGSLCEIKHIGMEIRDAVTQGNLRRFGELLDVHWQTKKRLSGGISNRLNGINTYTGTIEKFLAAPTRRDFDVITVLNVIEHVPAPREVLTGLRELLVEGGLIVLAVPDARLHALIGAARKKLGCSDPFWMNTRKHPLVGFDPPAHLCSFEPKTISQLVQKSGFQVLALRNAPVILNQDLWKNAVKTVLHAGSELLYLSTFGGVVMGYSTVIAARKI